MSYQLKHNGTIIIEANGWDPELFGYYTGTSYPKHVGDNYIWEHEGYWLGWIPDPEPIPPTPEEIAAQQEAENEQSRLEAYRNESDPLFFKWQRGEIDKQVWLDKVAEIKTRYS